MTQTVIRVQQLSKRYQLGRTKTYKTLRENITDLVRSPSRLFRLRSPAEYLWALQDVNLEIKSGEFVGIVGRNGAGKSTLMRVLARITEPTGGSIEIRGRTSALLEVGTGFHPELTGRENVYLNGSILGMKKTEINKSFDKIVDFSGVSRFIDTQVKHYSSGMRVRLAFSVASHLQPDILFVDEVLAVGDLDFQQKCLQKMREVTSQGRTVLLVSHNLAAIKEMSHKCILMNNGRLEYMGSVDEALARYSSSILEDQEQTNLGKGWSSMSVEGKGNKGSNPSSDEPFTAEAYLDLQEDFLTGTLFLIIKDPADNFVVHEKITTSKLGRPLLSGRHHIKIELPVLWLAAGVYVSRLRFVGHTAQGESKVFASPQTIFNVTGSFRGMDHSRVLLHPHVQWNVR